MPAPYDLRSDTVTKPTEAMREAMCLAEVGDDCYHDDPTVLALEREVALRLGKEDAVFVPSGTMANQLAVRLHTHPGEALASHVGAHVRIHEDASAASLSGVQIMPIGNRRGYTAEDLEALCREESCGWPRVGLVWLENTIGDYGGVLWPFESQSEIASWARARARPLHLDGARLWNAHVATGISLDRLASVADTVSVCLSKGLGAPMGSLLCGNRVQMDRARRLKHAFGGGFRQAGILAAAGLFALKHHIDRLQQDHLHAKRLAAAIFDIPGLVVRPPQSNMVVAEVEAPWESAEQLCERLRARSVICHPNTFREVRFVFHLGIDESDCDAVAQLVREEASNAPSGR